jgi:hypothetical protein
VQGGARTPYRSSIAAEFEAQGTVPDIGHLSQQLRIGFLPQHESPRDWSHMLDMTLYCPLPAMDLKI